MERINDILGYNLKIYQDPNFFSFSLDSIVLANYSKFKKNDTHIIDLCTGNGVIPIILNKRINKKIDCIEIQEKLCDLANKSFSLNNISDDINLFCGDLTEFFDSNYNNYYDVVLCNPPYFKVEDYNSTMSLSYEKRIARHEICLDLNGLFSCVKKILKNNGTFYMVHRPERLSEIIELMKKNNLFVKKIFFVHEYVSKDAILVFIETKLNGKDGLIVNKPLIMYNEDGSYTDEYSRLNKEVLK